MSDPREDLARACADGLQESLRGGGEAATAQAIEAGERALAAGLGIRDVVEVHRRAVELASGSASGAGDARVTAAAGALLCALVTPYDAALRRRRESAQDVEDIRSTVLAQKEALESAHRELESMSYSVSHDLRAPLRAIDGFSLALVDDYGDKLDAQGKELLGYLRTSAQRMARLVDALIGLARIARAPRRPARVDLSAAVRRIADRLRAAEPGRAVEFAVEDGVEADGDPDLLAAMLEHLVGSAWKFTSRREAAAIAFGHAFEAGVPVYFVRDNGAGFDMQYADKLFGVFQRLHRTNEYEGTGVGLAAVRCIVRRHGGTVRAQGEVDRGATFSFTLGGERTASVTGGVSPSLDAQPAGPPETRAPSDPPAWGCAPRSRP